MRIDYAKSILMHVYDVKLAHRTVRAFIKKRCTETDEIVITAPEGELVGCKSEILSSKSPLLNARVKNYFEPWSTRSWEINI